MYKLKEEIRVLKSRTESMRFQIKQQEDFRQENIRLKKGYDEVRGQIDGINKEKINIENNVNGLIVSYKNLIRKKVNNYLTLKSSYNKDLLERIETDNRCFEEQLSAFDNKTKELLDDLYSKVKQYCSCLTSGSDSNTDVAVDVDALKLNLKNVEDELSRIFTEVQNILNLSSQYIEEEEEETLRSIQVIEVVIEEVERLLQFVPNNQLIGNNNILSELGINNDDFPINTPTIRIILINMQEVKRKRQTQLRSILDEIKMRSSGILQKKSDIENEMNKAKNLIYNDSNKGNNSNNSNNTNNRIGEILNLENIFLTANQTNDKNIYEFGSNVIDKLKGDIEDYTSKIEAEAKEAEDTLSKIKEDLRKKLLKMKNEACEGIFEHIKKESAVHFQQFNEKYQQKYNDIVNILRQKFLSPECVIIKQGLLHCNETIDKIKSDISPVKCIIPIGENNDYLDYLNRTLLVNLPFMHHNNGGRLIDVYNDIEYSIKKITSNQNFEVIFPVLIVHYNNYEEYEKEINYIEELIIDCLAKKVSFLFFFNVSKDKHLTAINNKINRFIANSEEIQKALKDSKYELPNNLACSPNTIEAAVVEEMEKLTKFKKDIRNKIDKNELKKEYFEKMFDVYNSHPINDDLLSIKNAQDEDTRRNRLLNSIVEFSLLSVNLYNKPKTRQLKEREEVELNNKIEAVLTDLFENGVMEDYKGYLSNLIDRKLFELYLKREQLMVENDIEYNTSLLNEEGDGENIKSVMRKEIEKIMEDKYKKVSLGIVCENIWTSFFDRYCPRFYKLLEDGFEIPDDFDQYLLDSLTNS